MELVRSFADARALYRGVVGLVPTMGYFHEGHLALMKAARQGSDTVLVSHYVNPLQFNDPADLEAYPRDLDRDLKLALDEGVDVFFAPPQAEMFPTPPVTSVMVSQVAQPMEGVHRPGHFTGVATVVAKLFAGLQPHLAYFGRKDAQQLAVIRRLTTDLSFPVRVLAQPTVREADGLALSSRNVLLSPLDRPAALEISRGLLAASEAAEAGETQAQQLRGIVTEHLRTAKPDYVELASQDTALILDQLDRPAFLAVAARVGPVRLIDNIAFDLVGGQVIADRGLRLQQPSLLYS
ncbi:MAG TPA: pantoate--beta-alanine ligase [Acidimicrobiia bacterium]|nr:pantoate--beta-alanine ligase [Acidimicrobiia bacterium]